MRVTSNYGSTVLTVVAALVAACADPAGPAPGEPGIQVLAGDAQTDTIGAVLAQILEIEARDEDGYIAPDVAVTVGGCSSGCYVMVRQAGGGDPFTSSVTLVANNSGLVRVEVRLREEAGEWSIPIAIPSLDISGEATVTVLPGQAVRVQITPGDTALHPGASYEVLARTYDRNDNPRSDSVVLSTPTPSTISLGDSGVVDGLAFGRGRLVAISGALTDTADVSVVPPGTLAIAVYELPSHLATMDLDGSGYTEHFETGVLGGGAPSWDPDGQRIAYHYYGSARSGSLWITELGGVPVKLITDHPPSFAEEHNPRFSRNGEWIYFQGFTFTTQLGEIWRVRPDGTDLERIGTAGGPSGGENFPDPSPDGARIVLATDRGAPDSAARIVIRTVATGADLDLGVRGAYPRWSPTGEDIAFLRVTDSATPRTITIIKSDGTDIRPILARTGDYTFHGIEWSPDGEWLLMAESGGLILIQVATGMQLPLLTAGNLLTSSSWR